MRESYRRTNEPSPLEVEPSTAGASGGGDHGKSLPEALSPAEQAELESEFYDGPVFPPAEESYRRTNEPLEES